MKVIDLLNQLDEKGQLSTLYRSGCLNLRTYNMRDIYLRYQTLRASLKYENDNAGAVREVAQEFEISTRTVYDAVRAMQQLAPTAA